MVLACCGDIPTLETLAAAAILRERLPDLRVRVVNVVDLMRLQPESEHPHGLADREFDALFTADRPVIFAYHGYPWLIHRLTYRRANHANLHVRGYKEEGTTTTPFDMVMLNDLDRFHLVMDVDRPRAGPRRPGGGPAAGDGRPAAAGARVHARARRGRPGDPRLDLAGLSAADPRRQRRLDQPEARRRRRGRVGGDRRVAGRGARRRRRGRPPRSSTAAPRFRDPVLVDDDVVAAIQEVTPLAPLHNEPALRALEQARSVLPGPSRTSPSSTRPSTPRSRPRPSTYAVPRAVARGVGHAPLRLPRARRRVGRGAGAGAAARRLPPRRRLLGHGRARRPLGRHDDGLQPARGRADGDALRLGRSRARSSTSSASDGLSADELDDALEHESGLAALGGLDDPLGFAVYTYRVAQAVAAMAAALGGLDALAFSGGVGENREDVRRRGREPPAFLGELPGRGRATRARTSMIARAAARRARAFVVSRTAIPPWTRTPSGAGTASQSVAMSGTARRILVGYDGSEPGDGRSTRRPTSPATARRSRSSRCGTDRRSRRGRALAPAAPPRARHLSPAGRRPGREPRRGRACSWAWTCSSSAATRRRASPRSGTRPATCSSFASRGRVAGTRPRRATVGSLRAVARCAGNTRNGSGRWLRCRQDFAMVATSDGRR